jgi:hypothetical protein
MKCETCTKRSMEDDDIYVSRFLQVGNGIWVDLKMRNMSERRWISVQ